jgi:hypothetical protein
MPQMKAATNPISVLWSLHPQPCWGFRALGKNDGGSDDFLSQHGDAKTRRHQERWTPDNDGQQLDFDTLPVAFKDAEDDRVRFYSEREQEYGASAWPTAG